MDVPERLLAHASVALEDAAAMLSLGGRGGSFPPTVLTDSGHGVERARFVGDDNRIGLEQARRHVRETVRSGVVAIAWTACCTWTAGRSTRSWSRSATTVAGRACWSPGATDRPGACAACDWTTTPRCSRTTGRPCSDPVRVGRAGAVGPAT
ncbi:hypothetical protein GCM10025868_02420 [Angustibacter aerolatus]|uniref:Uncharacterized protein n=1 Tax=Angustibacter aerolatus TaxID=1162965 RepID=A0ABQ6JDK8_9ACTN|nr:hypothetical protein GCM10025868_02420 [Angustibacter aerolatus]